MFVAKSAVRKPFERAEARRLRRDEAMPIKRIAAQLGVSPSSVHAWTRDIELTPEQHRQNLVGPRGPANPEIVAARASAWRERNRERRRLYQLTGRERARRGDALHMAGCMLYWAEGAKNRNRLSLTNSDVHMLVFFRRFLLACFDIGPDDITICLNVYLNNGRNIDEVERYWLQALDLPTTCLRGHTLNHMPTSSSGRKKDRLPYGVCKLTVVRSTWLVQHIFGAIQEYGAFEEPRWLD
jgi:AcrR family transcriptional regulator